MNLLSEIIQAIRFKVDTRRSAIGTIRWLKRNRIVPETLVDAGANNSQWMRYLADEWPRARVISFEPQSWCKPIGTWVQAALSDHPGTGCLITEERFESRWIKGGAAHIRDECYQDHEPVKVVMLDQYENLISAPAVLKVDCEDHTLDALRGAPKTIGRFSCVVAEVFEDIFTPNTALPNDHMEIHKLMLDYGFDQAMTVGAIPWITSVSQTDVLFWKTKH